MGSIPNGSAPLQACARQIFKSCFRISCFRAALGRRKFANIQNKDKYSFHFIVNFFYLWDNVFAFLEIFWLKYLYWTKKRKNEIKLYFINEKKARIGRRGWQGSSPFYHEIFALGLTKRG
jgi:hypothetical protein